MPIVSYTTIGSGLIDKDKEALKRYFLLERNTVAKTRSKYSRQDKIDLINSTYIGLIADAWNNLTEEDKTAWSAAGALVDLDGYNLFVQDKSFRIKNSLVGNATPSIIHQYLVGHLGIEEGSGDCQFKQQGDDVVVFPATLYLSRKSDLYADPSNGEFIKVRFSYNYDEGGGVITQTDELTLDLQSPWAVETLPITEHTGQTGSWLFEIETHALKGDFYFDNLYMQTAGGIITKDPFCNEVLRRWLLLKYPAGAIIESLYPTGGAL